MGQVYEAEESESGRRVAIKILSRGLGDDEERARFLSEGRVAASLSHPNSVYIFGTCEVQGLPVIAMELAPAGTLKDLLVDGEPLAPPAAVDAILQVIAGLAGSGRARHPSSRHQAVELLRRSRRPHPGRRLRPVDRDARPRTGNIGRHRHDRRHTRLRLARTASRGTARRAVRHLLGRRDDLLPADRPAAVRGRARDRAGDAHGDGSPRLAGRHSPRRSERARRRRHALPGAHASGAVRELSRAGGGARAVQIDDAGGGGIVAPLLRERRRQHRVVPGR